MLQFSRVSLNLVLLAAALIIVQPVPFTVYLPPQITTKTSTISVGPDSLVLGNEKAPNVTANPAPIISSDSNSVNSDEEFKNVFFNNLSAIRSPNPPQPVEQAAPVSKPVPAPEPVPEPVPAPAPAPAPEPAPVDESLLTQEANQLVDNLDAPHGIGEAYPEHQRLLPGESYVEELGPEDLGHPPPQPPPPGKKPCNKKLPMTVVRMLDTVRMFLKPDYQDDVCVDIFPSRNCYYGTARPEEAAKAIKVIQKKPGLFGHYLQVKSTIFDPNGIRRHLPFFDADADQWLLYLGSGCEQTGPDGGMCLRVMVQSYAKKP